MGTAKAKTNTTPNGVYTLLYELSQPTAKQKRQAVNAALALYGYRVGRGQVSGCKLRRVIRAGGAK